MDFKFSQHAIDQICERKISKDTVKKILLSPIKVVQDNELSIYHGIINEENKQYLIRIFVNHSVQPAVIITVYRTSKIKKYHED